MYIYMYVYMYFFFVPLFDMYVSMYAGLPSTLQHPDLHDPEDPTRNPDEKGVHKP